MRKKYLLGYDIGSSSIKASILDAQTGAAIAVAQSPSVEMKINSPQLGWAEQDPETWWDNLKKATQKILNNINSGSYEIASIGISYQMHGLVLVDNNYKVIYPSIIWCDSRAVGIGEKAFNDLGKEHCLSHFLNSPGNFTLSKLKWVKDNLPDIFKCVYKIMLPGDYIAMKITNEIKTTISGLSEGIFWDFKKNELSNELLDYFEIDKNLISDLTPTFGEQGKLTKDAANELGLEPGISVSYRAGDQPNNALSLNVLKPGEIAATAGTSGVVYGITEQNLYDNYSRVNAFAHVNYSLKNQYKGVLLCINGTGILYQWLKNVLFSDNFSYDQMNNYAADAPIGSEGLITIPFGNGAERSLNNREVNGHFVGFNYNKHTIPHLVRSALEGIACSFNYGLEIMKDMGMEVNVLRVGDANLFLSPIFCEAIANICDVNIEVYNTDGSQGAARGGGIGAKVYNSFDEAFKGLKKIKNIPPVTEKVKRYNKIYERWNEKLLGLL
ncbi:xylulokinase [Bacteroidota bacterium]